MACVTPCPECPYRKTSVRGYFGGNDAEDYRQAISQDTIVPCHMRSKYDEQSEVVNPESTVCPGQVLAQMNSCKRPSRNQHLIEAHAQVKQAHSEEKLKELRSECLSIFDWDKHHTPEDIAIANSAVEV